MAAAKKTTTKKTPEKAEAGTRTVETLTAEVEDLKKEVLRLRSEVERLEKAAVVSPPTDPHEIVGIARAPHRNGSLSETVVTRGGDLYYRELGIDASHPAGRFQDHGNVHEQTAPPAADAVIG